MKQKKTTIAGMMIIKQKQNDRGEVWLKWIMMYHAYHMFQPVLVVLVLAVLVLEVLVLEVLVLEVLVHKR